jgi:hypothetical protein
MLFFMLKDPFFFSDSCVRPGFSYPSIRVAEALQIGQPSRNRKLTLEKSAYTGGPILQVLCPEDSIE